MNKRKMKRTVRLLFLIAFATVIASLSASIIIYGKSGDDFVRPDLVPMIEEISGSYGVSPELIEAMIEIESDGRSDISNGDCYGLMQVSTRWHADRAARLGVDITTDYGNIITGIDYLMELAADNEDLFCVLATYNGQSDAEEGKRNDYADKIIQRSCELEYIHGKRDYEYR